MKWLTILISSFVLFIIPYECSAYTNVIKSTNIPKSSNTSSIIIKNRTQKDAEINKIDSELNRHRGRSDGYSMQKSMELEKQRIDIRNSN